MIFLFGVRNFHPVFGGNSQTGKSCRKPLDKSKRGNYNDLTIKLTQTKREVRDKMSLQHCLVPVSYTHLDVYKRQFMHGFSHESEFDGAAYCERGVILVTINYRLGAFGFLAHPWLSEESGVGRSGNYAILDQIAALKWVKENIAAFGGDPENITVFGQSAGCMSVQTLISSPLTENWISKAIFQSAGGYDTGLNRDMPLSEAETIGQEFVELSGAKSLEELRAIPAEKIVELQEEFGRVNPSRMLSFVPNIDNHLLTCGYNDAVTEGKIKDIPYMLGSTADDIGVFPEMKEKGEHGGIYKGCILSLIHI